MYRPVLCISYFKVCIICKSSMNSLEKESITIIIIHASHSLSAFSLAESLQLILEDSVTHRLVSYLLADN